MVALGVVAGKERHKIETKWSDISRAHKTRNTKTCCGDPSNTYTKPPKFWERLILTHGLQKRTTTQTSKPWKPRGDILTCPLLSPFWFSGAVSYLYGKLDGNSNFFSETMKKTTKTHHHASHDHHQRTDRSQAHIRPHRRRLPSAEQRPRR